jgi:hypothetical protein
MNELTPRDVLVDLFGGADFDHEILDPEQAAAGLARRFFFCPCRTRRSAGSLFPAPVLEM